MICHAPWSRIFSDLVLSKGSNWPRENKKWVPYDRKHLVYMLCKNVLQYSQNASCPFGQTGSLERGRQSIAIATKKKYIWSSHVQGVRLLFNQIWLFWNNMTEFLSHVDANRQCSRYLHWEYNFKTRQTNKKKSLLNSFNFLEFAKAAYC